MDRNYSFEIRLTPGVRWLIAINTISFVIVYLLALFAGNFISVILDWFILTPAKFVYNFAIWQIITYMFFHANIFHILFNMLALWMFGTVLEEYWGTKRFIIYYFLTGIGAGIFYVGFSFITGSPGIPTLGASGSVYGLLLAFGVIFPDLIILMLFLFPMKAKYAVIIFAAVEFLMSFQMTGVAHIAHLGGMFFGYIYIKKSSFFDELLDLEKRKKKKLEEIMIKRDEDYVRIQQEADKILQKISLYGMEKISEKERRTLDKASKLLRQREENIIDLDEYRKYWR